MMIHNIPKPEITSDFTIDDIHKIREWHDEILRDATPDEIMVFYEEGASETRRAIEEIRRRKREAVGV